MGEKCHCKSGNHGHKPGECKNDVKHQSDQMCDPCHDRAAKEAHDAKVETNNPMPRHNR
jgi:hypothetical protein